MEYGIKQLVLEEIIRLANVHNIEKIYLFGSRARGDYKERSDIDLATVGGNHAAFSLDIEEETSTLLKYDIVNLDGQINDELYNEIMKEGKVIYEKVR